jgi:hemerythrin-like domain-containing protein
MSQRWDELLKRDHEVTERVFAAMEAKFSCADPPPPALVGLLVQYLHYVDQCHNQKEELHLFPRLEQMGMPRHGGPLGVMLQEHDRAREILARLAPLATAYAAGDRQTLAELAAAFAEYAALCKDHFWKENDILYPMALRMLDDGQAAEVVAGIEQVEAALGAGTRAHYYRIAEEIVGRAELPDLSFGLERDVLAAILNTLPVELSFIDHEDRVRYFSHEHGEHARRDRHRGAQLPPAEEPAPGQPDPRRLQGRQAGGGGILDRHERTHDPHPLLAGPRRRRPLPGHAGNGAGRHRDPQADRRAAAARPGVRKGAGEGGHGR